MKLLRMISSIHKWDGTNGVNRENAYISGDAISDLRTTENKISVWKADIDEDVKDAIVALALNRDKVNKLEYFILEESELEKLDIKVSNSEMGKVAGLPSDILSKHRDLIEIDYWSLGFLAEYMTKLLQEKNIKTYSRKDVKDLLNEYRAKNKIDESQIKENIKSDLNW